MMLTSCGLGVEYACRMRQLKVCPDGSASTAWDYAGLLYNLYQYAGPKRCHHSQTSLAQSPQNSFYTWYNLLLNGLNYWWYVSST